MYKTLCIYIFMTFWVYPIKSELHGIIATEMWLNKFTLDKLGAFGPTEGIK